MNTCIPGAYSGEQLQRQASSDHLQLIDEGTPALGSMTEILPGLHWFRLPLPYALDHINIWILEEVDQIFIIDTGFALAECQAAWQAVLARFNRPVGGIVVTHCHPDHIGLAQWLGEQPQATNTPPVWITSTEILSARALFHQLPGFSNQDMLQFFQHHGLSARHVADIEARGNAFRRGVNSLPTNYQRLQAGQSLQLGRRTWRIITGYGHSPEHASLYCEKEQILISGDMLLPKISTNISVWASTPEADPLDWFLRSLEEFHPLPKHAIVLPSHGKPFCGAHIRIAQLNAHHQERCHALRGMLDQPRCAAELLDTLFMRKLDAHQTMFAMGEAIAHLNYLMHRKLVTRIIDHKGIFRFQCINQP